MASVTAANVLIECRFPMFTLVLSTATATQLLHGTSNNVIQRSRALNISRAVQLGVIIAHIQETGLDLITRVNVTIYEQ